MYQTTSLSCFPISSGSPPSVECSSWSLVWSHTPELKPCWIIPAPQIIRPFRVLSLCSGHSPDLECLLPRVCFPTATSKCCLNITPIRKPSPVLPSPPVESCLPSSHRGIVYVLFYNMPYCLVVIFAASITCISSSLGAWDFLWSRSFVLLSHPPQGF